MSENIAINYTTKNKQEFKDQKNSANSNSNEKNNDDGNDNNKLVLDEDDIRKLLPKERFQYCKNILTGKSEKSSDESMRWDAIWLAGEITDNLKPEDAMFGEIADLFTYVLENDTNGVVKHEACFQIAARDMREKIPDLVNTALHDDTVLARHEAIEALGLMRAFEVEDTIYGLISDSNRDVSETAKFTLKRLARLKDKGKYVPSSLL